MSYSESHTKPGKGISYHGHLKYENIEKWYGI